MYVFMKFIKRSVIVLMIVILPLSIIGCGNPEIKEMNNKIEGTWFFEGLVEYGFRQNGFGHIVILDILTGEKPSSGFEWEIVKEDDVFFLVMNYPDDWMVVGGIDKREIISLTENSLTLEDDVFPIPYKFSRTPLN